MDRTTLETAQRTLKKASRASEVPSFPQHESSPNTELTAGAEPGADARGERVYGPDRW